MAVLTTASNESPWYSADADLEMGAPGNADLQIGTCDFRVIGGRKRRAKRARRIRAIRN